MLSESLNLDQKDMKIVSWVMKNPFISQTEIAEKLNLSQPSVNARLKKLKQSGVLHIDAGMNLKGSKLVLARIDFTAKNADSVFQRMKLCPYFVNGFAMAGKNNVSIFIVHEDLKKIDEIVTDNLRNDSDISDISINVVVDSVNDFLFKINLEKEIDDPKHCYKKNACNECDVMHTPAKINVLK